MKRLCELLLHPFTVVSLIWIMTSISIPFRRYNDLNDLWQLFGIIIILVTIILAVVVVRNNKKSN